MPHSSLRSSGSSRPASRPYTIAIEPNRDPSMTIDGKRYLKLFLEQVVFAEGEDSRVVIPGIYEITLEDGSTIDIGFPYNWYLRGSHDPGSLTSDQAVRFEMFFLGGFSTDEMRSGVGPMFDNPTYVANGSAGAVYRSLGRVHVGRSASGDLVVDVRKPNEHLTIDPETEEVMIERRPGKVLKFAASERFSAAEEARVLHEVGEAAEVVGREQTTIPQRDEDVVGGVLMDDHGIDLHTFICKDYLDSLPEERRIKLVRNIMEEVARVHALGIVHRDIKPENFTIDPATLEVKLIDFGDSLRRTAGGKLEYLTSEGKPMFGSREYFAPETIKEFEGGAEGGDLTRAYSMADEFQLAGVILQVLGATKWCEPRLSDDPKQTLMCMKRSYSFDGFMSGNYSRRDKKVLDRVVRGLAEVDPDRRLKIEDAVAILQRDLVEERVAQQQVAEVQEATTSIISSGLRKKLQINFGMIPLDEILKDFVDSARRVGSRSRTRMFPEMALALLRECQVGMQDDEKLAEAILGKRGIKFKSMFSERSELRELAEIALENDLVYRVIASNGKLHSGILKVCDVEVVAELSRKSAAQADEVLAATEPKERSISVGSSIDEDVAPDSPIVSWEELFINYSSDRWVTRIGGLINYDLMNMTFEFFDAKRRLSSEEKRIRDVLDVAGSLILREGEKLEQAHCLGRSIKPQVVELGKIFERVVSECILPNFVAGKISFSAPGRIYDASLVKDGQMQFMSLDSQLRHHPDSSFNYMWFWDTLKSLYEKSIDGTITPEQSRLLIYFDKLDVLTHEHFHTLATSDDREVRRGAIVKVSQLLGMAGRAGKFYEKDLIGRKACEMSRRLSGSGMFSGRRSASVAAPAEVQAERAREAVAPRLE